MPGVVEARGGILAAAAPERGRTAPWRPSPSSGRDRAASTGPEAGTIP
jgi:hypothetical protein